MAMQVGSATMSCALADAWCDRELEVAADEVIE
jgi:hypothetical protein